MYIEAPGLFYFAGNRGKRGGVGCGGVQAVTCLPLCFATDELCISVTISTLTVAVTATAATATAAMGAARTGAVTVTAPAHARTTARATARAAAAAVTAAKRPQPQPQVMMSVVLTTLIFRPYPKCGIYIRSVWPAVVVGACLRGKDTVPGRVVVSSCLILAPPKHRQCCTPCSRVGQLSSTSSLINTQTYRSRDLLHCRSHQVIPIPVRQPTGSAVQHDHSADAAAVKATAAVTIVAAVCTALHLYCDHAVPYRGLFICGEAQCAQ